MLGLRCTTVLVKLVQEKPALLPPHHQPTVLHQCLAVLKRDMPDPTSGHLDQVRTGRADRLDLLQGGLQT